METAVATSVENPPLLRHLDRRLPRYTSYPTAVEFHRDVNQATYAHWLESLPAQGEVSLYLHVPFCAELCLYCACHTTVAFRRGSSIGWFAMVETRSPANPLFLRDEELRREGEQADADEHPACHAIHVQSVLSVEGM